MEKNYEKPLAMIVKYQKRVKTTAQEFTDSNGEVRYRFICECGQCLFTFSENESEAEAARHKKIFDDHWSKVHNG